jgi:hypothetical protein
MFAIEYILNNKDAYIKKICMYIQITWYCICKFETSSWLSSMSNMYTSNRQLRNLEVILNVISSKLSISERFTFFT